MAKAKTVRRNVVRDLTILENSLKRKLLTFYNTKIKPEAGTTPIEQLKQRYNSYIINLIRKTVQDSYLKGNELVGRQIKITDFDIVITGTDIDNIAKISAAMTTSFWNTASKLHRRETEFKLNKDRELEEKEPFDKNAAMVAASALVVYSAFNGSILSKTQEIPQPARVQFTTANDSHVDPKLCQPHANEIFDENNVPIDAQPPLHRHCRCILVPLPDIS